MLSYILAAPNARTHSVDFVAGRGAWTNQRDFALTFTDRDEAESCASHYRDIGLVVHVWTRVEEPPAAQTWNRLLLFLAVAGFALGMALYIGGALESVFDGLLTILLLMGSIGLGMVQLAKLD